MKNVVKVSLVIVITFISFIILDSVYARVFKKSPIISKRDSNLLDDDSYVDRGILIDTYYCVKEKDMVKVEWHFKIINFDCPVE